MFRCRPWRRKELFTFWPEYRKSEKDRDIDCEQSYFWVNFYRSETAARFLAGSEPPCRYAESGRKRRANNLRRSQELATAWGGRCLASENPSMQGGVMWECSAGHQWLAYLTNVINGGTWCPECPRPRSGRADNLARSQRLAEERGVAASHRRTFRSRRISLGMCRRPPMGSRVLRD